MSVEEFNPRFTNEEIPFFIIHRNVVQEISNPEAGFVWVYLRSMSAEWKVIKKHIQNKFGFGSDKVKDIFSWLNKHQLIEYVRERDENGKLKTCEIKVLNGSRFISIIESDLIESVDKATTGVKSTPMVTTGVKNQRVAKPAGGKQVTNINNINKYKQKEQRESSASLPTPSFFEPDDQNLFYAKDHGVDIQRELSEFSRIKSRQPKDQVEFKRWLEKAVDYKSTRSNQSPKQEIRSTVPDYGPGHPSWELKKKWDMERQKEKSTVIITENVQIIDPEQERREHEEVMKRIRADRLKGEQERASIASRMNGLNKHGALNNESGMASHSERS